MRSIHDISLLDILPPSIVSDEDVKAAALAIDIELKLIADRIKDLTLFYSIDRLPSDWVDELAWQYHVDFYEAGLPIDKRRELVKNSLKTHRIAGTPAAVEELIKTLFGDGRVEEWFEYGGQPYHFRVTTSNPDVTASRAAEFIRAVKTVQNERSVLESVQLRQTSEQELYVGVALHIGDYMRID
ncbi:phage tail protein I [Paenibacillus ehimensis]|uniref:phage tail protein I n=1 Tax=Paenibacillus ehimensis TaxID=79264 RepID=UPI0004705064|nr:phage tail protein I [Paenibacillus ehimensis]